MITLPVPFARIIKSSLVNVFSMMLSYMCMRLFINKSVTATLLNDPAPLAVTLPTVNVPLIV